jgi:hypothetical protein
MMQIRRHHPFDLNHSLMFAISSSRRDNSLLVEQAVQRVRHWARQEARASKRRLIML